MAVNVQVNPLESLIQGFQVGQQLTPAALQQRNLSNQLALQLQQIQVQKAQQQLSDLLNPDQALSRQLRAELAGQSFNPVSGVVPIPIEVGSSIIQTPGAITQEQQDLLQTRQIATDEAGLPSPVLPTAQMGAPIVPFVLPNNQPSGFGQDIEAAISNTERLTRAKGTSALDRLLISNAQREADRLSREVIATAGNVSRQNIATTRASAAGGGRALTPNQQTNLRLRGGRSLVDINQFTDPETGIIDWNAYASKVGEAEGNTLNANNLIKSARAAKASGKTTLDEKNFQLYGNRMTQANDALQDLENKGFDPTSLGTEGLLGGWAPNLLKSNERQQFEQAERNFINAVLRRESGAVITDDEFANARSQYLAQPGDGAPVLAQKLANRKLVVDEFKRLGGQEVPEQASQSPVRVNTKAERDALATGTIYIDSKGKRATR